MTQSVVKFEPAMNGVSRSSASGCRGLVKAWRSAIALPRKLDANPPRFNWTFANDRFVPDEPPRLAVTFAVRYGPTWTTARVPAVLRDWTSAKTGSLAPGTPVARNRVLPWVKNTLSLAFCADWPTVPTVTHGLFGTNSLRVTVGTDRKSTRLNSSH